MDVGVPREGASDGVSKIFFLSNLRKVYAIKVLSPSHAYTDFHANPCKFRNFQNCHEIFP